MNGSYYKNPSYPSSLRPTGTPPTISSNGIPIMDTTNELPMEQSYVENILRANKGKKVSAYVSYSDSVEWRDKIFTGIIEQAGRDHLILSDPNTGKWYLILMIYLDYVEFDEKINYGL